jgi:hypothetical protein
MINLDDLTLGQIKELKNAVGCDGSAKKHSMLFQYVIIRTYSAGVWCGTLAEKDGKEVILKDARRMYRWWSAESISLSGVALFGIIDDKSKIVQAVPSVWLEAIEIIPCSDVAVKSLTGAKNVKAQ